ncbi:MAG: TIM44-like domain-containing protein [Planctomycetes bacterium]|nr:TIM44-like domain-containing protein [Planctomycetota bacterium]
MPAALVSLAAFVAALLQAGGGGSFGGGGGGGGGGGFGGHYGGGGDGDGGVLVYLLLRLLFEHPLIGIPLLVVVLVLVAKGRRAGGRRLQERRIGRDRELRREHAARASVDALRAHDPSFDEAGFLARVTVAFHKAQDAWCAQDLTPLAPFVSDGIYERFSLQLEEQRREGWRQGMQGTTLRTPTFAHVDTTGAYETLTVHLPFQAVIDRRDLETGRALPGSTLPRNHFEECWTFVRRRGARTRNGEGLIEGRCPNCGADLDVNRVARCGSCEAWVRSGEFDWVLTEITQASVWRAEDATSVAGWAPLTASDPDLSPQLLEDQASVAFWRERAAEARGTAEPLVRVATPGFVERFGERLGEYQAGERVYTGDAAVGSVRTLGFLLGAGVERAVLEIVWDGRRARTDRAGRVQLESQRMLRASLYVFERPAGTRTDVASAFSTANCRTCGAHDAGGTDPRCPYCDAPRVPKGAWLLDERSDAGSPEGRALLEALARADAPGLSARLESVPAPAGLLAWAAALLRSDGDVDQRDRQALRKLATRLGLNELALEAALAADDAAVTRPPSPEAGRRWFAKLVELALEDGHLARAEHDFLRDAGERLGLSREAVRHELDAARARLLAASRAARGR